MDVSQSSGIDEASALTAARPLNGIAVQVSHPAGSAMPIQEADGIAGGGAERTSVESGKNTGSTTGISKLPSVTGGIAGHCRCWGGHMPISEQGNPGSGILQAMLKGFAAMPPALFTAEAMCVAEEPPA
mmetsp:Transcript_52484/g.152798  ORF Transcript_52484/g.152798 Transcript_52484/m.152798 type:complete len:129 (-) Transcript_52484:27-413(-)